MKERGWQKEEGMEGEGGGAKRVNETVVTHTHTICILSRKINKEKHTYQKLLASGPPTLRFSQI